MAVIQLPNNIPPRAWIIGSIAFFILALGIAISFILGWSTIHAQVKKDVDKVEEVKPNE